MNKTKTIAVYATIVAMVAILSVSVFAQGFGRQNSLRDPDATLQGSMMGRWQNENGFSGRGMMRGKMGTMHTEVQKLLEAKDFEGFVALHEQYGMPMQITEEQFLKMSQWHEAVENEDYETMQQMRDEGFPPGFGMMKSGRGKGMMGKGSFSGGCPMMQ